MRVKFLFCSFVCLFFLTFSSVNLFQLVLGFVFLTLDAKSESP